MGELVPHAGGASNALSLVLQQKDPEVLEAEQAKRIEEVTHGVCARAGLPGQRRPCAAAHRAHAAIALQANKLEEKLKVIQESVPTRIYNTMSSSAGAGSSDFHMYRMVSERVAHAAGGQGAELVWQKREQDTRVASRRHAAHAAANTVFARRSGKPSRSAGSASRRPTRRQRSRRRSRCGGGPQFPFLSPAGQMRRQRCAARAAHSCGVRPAHQALTTASKCCRDAGAEA